MNPIKRRSFLALLGLGAWASKKVVESAPAEPVKIKGVSDAPSGVVNHCVVAQDQFALETIEFATETEVTVAGHIVTLQPGCYQIASMGNRATISRIA